MSNRGADIDARPATVGRSRRRFLLRSDDVLPALMFVVLGALALLTPVQNDTFWHLRSGQEIWRTGAPLAMEPFAFTSTGERYHDHWWLSQLAFYGLYSLGGAFLLTAFAGACAFASVVLTWKLLKGTWESRVVLLAWLVALVLSGWAIRPQVISLVFVALTVYLITRHKFTWLPVIMAVWSNFHALVVLGVAIVGASVIESLFWSRRELRRSLVVTVLCIAAPMASPVGVDFWPQALRSVAVSQALHLQEYAFPDHPTHLPFWAAAIALGCLIVLRRPALATAPRRERILLVAALVLAGAGASAARNIPVFGLVAIPVISWLWSAGYALPESSRIRPASRIDRRLVLVAGAVAVWVVAGRWENREWQVNEGTRMWRPLSASLVKAVQACPEPTFNRFDDGGFLMWALPYRKVFVDSRINAYSEELFAYSTAADLHGDYSEAFDRYGINCAVVGTGSPMAERLREDSAFEVSYADRDREVFVRRSP